MGGSVVFFVLDTPKKSSEKVRERISANIVAVCCCYVYLALDYVNKGFLK
ncbi:unnamed protein product [Nippostrongylus brasiliensis]|uniref:Uncharacterized protein n=1 Tax=Nippostrongylus brasiliensis TaxID=27835 RepID=A0A0N4YNI0_NIPBR|nr:unnamed protein product [Nippostrongylus brasiliensis]